MPLLIGANRDEAVYPLTLGRALPAPGDDAALLREIARFATGDAEALLAQARASRPGASRQALLVAAVTEHWMGRPARLLAQRKAASGRAPVFLYDFAWKTPCFGGNWAIHGIEIPFVFGNLDYRFAWDGNDTPAIRAAADARGERFRLKDATIAFWTQFARTGSPARPAAWPPFAEAHPARMVLDGRGGTVEESKI